MQNFTNFCFYLQKYVEVFSQKLLFYVYKSMMMLCRPTIRPGLAGTFPV